MNNYIFAFIATILTFSTFDDAMAQTRTRSVVCRNMFGDVVSDSECPAPKPATAAACPSTPTSPSGCNWTLTITGGMGAAGSCGTTNFLCPQNAGTCSTPGQTQFRNNCGCDGNEWTAGTYTCQCQPTASACYWRVTPTAPAGPQYDTDNVIVCGNGEYTCDTSVSGTTRNCGSDLDGVTAQRGNIQCICPSGGGVWTRTSTERCNDYFATCGSCDGCAGYSTRKCPTSVEEGQPCSGGGFCYKANGMFNWFDILTCVQ